MALNFDDVDLSEFSVVDQDTQLNANMTEAVKINPDQQAKTMKLSEQSGVPTFAVEDNPTEIEEGLKRNDIDVSNMSKRSPNTAKYLVDFNNAVLAQDDIDVMQSIEDIFDINKAFKNLGESSLLSFSAQGAGLVQAGVDKTPSRIQDLVPASAMPMGMEMDAVQLSEEFASNFGIDTDEQLQQAKTDATEKMLGRLREIHTKRKELTPEDLNLLEQGVRSGIESLANMAPGFGLMVLTGGRAAPLLATIGVQTFGESYGQARSEGLTPEQSSWFASINAAIEVGTELLPTGTLETIITGSSKGLTKDALKFLVQEMGTEQLATLGQSINEFAFGLDEQMEAADTVEEMVQIQVRRQAVTAIATIVAGGAQAAAATGVRKTIQAVAKDGIAKETQGDTEQRNLDRLNETAEQSKLRERSRESFKQFVEEADGENNTTVFIDAAQTSLYLQTKTREEITNDPGLTLLREQVNEAAALGGDVAIPVADFATDVAGTEHFAQLRDSMTMSDETISPFRQEQVEQETQTYIRTLLDEADENVSQFVEAQEIYSTVKQQLVDSGQVNAANASIMAQVVPAWATAQARRSGKTVEQVYQESGLIIEGPLTGEKERLEAERELLTQEQIEQDSDLTALAEFNQMSAKERFKNTKVRTTAVDNLVQRHLDDDQFQGLQLPSATGVVAITPSAKEPGEWQVTQFDKSFQPISDEGAQTKEQALQSFFDEARPELTADLLAQEDIEQPETLAQELVSVPDEVVEEGVQFDPDTAEYPLAPRGEWFGDADFKERGGEIVMMNPQQYLDSVAPLKDTELTLENIEDLQTHIEEGGQLDPLAIFEGGKEDGRHRARAAINLDIDQVPVILFGDQIERFAELLEQPVSEGAPGARGYYDPANSIIRLTESADLSTFLHEFAHFMYEMEVSGDTEMLDSINNWYKRNAEDVAKEANSYLTKKGFDAEKQLGDEAPADITITPEDVIEYLDDGTTGDRDLDSTIRRAVHEQFARGFETYLMEGKAPSIELRNAFRTFARWLSQIYQTLRGDLNVNLDLEMRQVFDRMLATEEQIAAAEARQRIEPMFTDAAMAGMTEEEFTDYEKRQSKVKDVQSETLRDKMIKQLTRQTQAWWDQEKQLIIDEELDSLKDQRVHAARSQLEDGDIKLDFATVKEMIGEQKTDRIGRKRVIISPKLNGMTAKEHQGLHPDEAALILGYDSGAEMLEDLTSAPSLKDAADTAAEARMVEIHGDILTDGTIEREADEAVQSEERGKLLLHELKIVARGTNAPTVDRQTIKAIAAERIGRLSFRQIFPGKYRSAEIRAAQEAGRMLAEGNKEGAAQAKMRQVMNYYLGMEATDAKNKTTAIVDGMARYNKKKVREEIQKAENGYWEQITKILERFEFRKSATLKQVEAVNQNINTWAAERIETDGDGLVLSNAVLNELFITHWKNVPFSDLQGISDSVKNIEHVARYSNKMNAIAEDIEFKKLKANWVDSIETQDQRFERKDSKSRTADARDATTSENVRRWASQLTKVPFLASWLDGGARVGISHQILIQPLTNALDAKLNLVDEVATPVNNAILDRSKADQKRHMRKIWIPEINDHLMGHQVLAVALNTGNAGNLRKLLLGEGWADPDIEGQVSLQNPQLQAVLRHMTKSDWELVQLIWDQMETLFPQLAEVHRRTTGLAPPKVESVPVETAFGTFKGGYYPVKYSPARSHKAEKNAEKLTAETESMFNNTASIQASVNTGATNERTGFYDRINLSLDVVPDHFNETIHYITHHDAVRQINKLIQAPDVANAISGVLGEAEFKQLKPWLNDVAKDGRQQPTKTYIDEIFQRLRFGVTLGVMGFKASTGIMQFFGLFTTAAEIGVGPTVKGIYTAIGRSWYTKAVRRTLGSVDDMQSGWDFAVERSKVMKHRAETMDREIRNAMTRLKGKRGIIAATQEVSMKHIALIQTYMVDLPTWLAAYDKKVSETGDETLAAQFADLMVESLQGSGSTKDMAAIVRNQSKVITTFTMFMTFFSSLGNLSRDLVKGARTGRYSPTSVAAKTMFLFTIPVFMEMLMRGDLDEPEGEDDRLSKYATGVALYPLASIPFVRDVAGGLIGDFGYNSSPVSAMLERGIAGAKGIIAAGMTDKEITKAQVKNATKLAGAAAGIPGVSQMWATSEHLYDVLEEGEEFTVRELLFGPKRD